MLPFVLFAESTGEFLEGHSGAIGAEELQRILERIAPAPASPDVEQVTGLVDAKDQPRREPGYRKRRRSHCRRRTTG